MKESISRVSRYLKSKYPHKYTLKLTQVANEFLMPKEQIKELRRKRLLKSFHIKDVSTFIVHNPSRTNLPQEL